MGEIKALSLNLRTLLKKTMHLTRNNKQIIVNLAINYGSKNEIFQAIKKTTKKKLNIKNLEKNFFF